MKAEKGARHRPGTVMLLGAILVLVGLCHFVVGVGAVIALFLQDLYLHPLAAHHLPNPDLPWQGLHYRLTEHLPAFSAIILLLSGWLAGVGAGQISSGFGLFMLKPWAPYAAKLIGFVDVVLALIVTGYLYLAIRPQVQEYVDSQQLRTGMEVQLGEWIGPFWPACLIGALIIYGITFALLASRSAQEALTQEP